MDSKLVSIGDGEEVQEKPSNVFVPDFGDPPCKWGIFSVVCLLAYLCLGILLYYWDAIAEMSQVLGYGLLLVMIPGLMLGCAFSGHIWTYIGKGIFGSSFNLCLTCCICGIPGFICFAFVAAGASQLESPFRAYRELASLQPLQDVSVCSTTWEDFLGGIYFKDGTLTQGGHMPEATTVEIPECYRVVSWKFSYNVSYACHVRVRPIFNCDPQSSTCPTPRACAWAMTAFEESHYKSRKENEEGRRLLEAPKAPECGRSNSLCGIQFNFQFYMTRMARNPQAMDILRGALQTSGAQFPGLTKDSPLVMLLNPAQFRADTLDGMKTIGIAWFLFVPFGAISGILMAVCKGLCGSGFRRFEDDDEYDSGASSGE